MYKIGEFSILAKTTIKTLRYYEKEKILVPAYIDPETNYRYYQTSQLIELARIISFRQIGFRIDEIKSILNGANLKCLLKEKKKELKEEMKIQKTQLLKINYLLEGKEMNYEVIMKKLPEYTVYYKEGKIKDFSEITDFILTSAKECMSANQNIKCKSPDYCYVNYLDSEFKQKDLKIRYAQAVETEGVSTENIKFTKLEPVEAVCIYHKGSYENLPTAYHFIMKYIEENHYQIVESPRERYIDGMWNKEQEEDWLTEIQVPVEKIEIY